MCASMTVCWLCFLSDVIIIIIIITTKMSLIYASLSHSCYRITIQCCCEVLVVFYLSSFIVFFVSLSLLRWPSAVQFLLAADFGETKLINYTARSITVYCMMLAVPSRATPISLLAVDSNFNRLIFTFIN